MTRGSLPFNVFKNRLYPVVNHLYSLKEDFNINNDHFEVC